MERNNFVKVMKEIEKQVNFDEIRESVINGLLVKGEMECPYCGGKAVYELYSHKRSNHIGMGVRSYCEMKKCYSLTT